MPGENNSGTQDQASSGAGQDQASNSNDQASSESSQSQNQSSQQNNGTSNGQLTTADYDRILKEVRAENAKFRTELKSFKDSQSSAEEEKLKNEKKFEELATKKEKEANELRLQLAQRDRALLVAKVVAKHKLPDDLADMLVGDTEADLEASAAKLSKHLKPPTAANTEGGSGGNSRQAGQSSNGNNQQAGQGQQQNRTFIFQQPGDVAW